LYFNFISQQRVFTVANAHDITTAIVTVIIVAR
jgi:hypothetical protein